MEWRHEMATLKDIAEKANVSITTVSKVVNFNDTTVCSEEKQRLIWSLVESEGYKVRRRGGRANKGQKQTYKLAYIAGLPNYANADTLPYQIIRGVESESFKKGVSLPFTCMNLNLYTPEKLCQKLKKLEINTVIWIAGTDEEYLSMLKKNNIHVILTGIEPSVVDDDTDYVGINFYSETLKWLNLKLFNRFDHVGFIGPTSLARYNAYIDAHKLMGREPNPDYIIDIADYDSQLVEPAIYNYLDKGLPLPEVFFVSSDAMAFGAIKSLLNKGIAVPDTVKILGFDNVDMASMFSPGLSTIGIPAFKIGVHAVNVALSKIKGERDYSLQHIFPTKFYDRDTL